MTILKHFKGVRFGKGIIYFGQTDTTIRMDGAFFKDLFAVMKINNVISWRRLMRGTPNGTLAFAPMVPGPWYNARYAGHLAGLKFVNLNDAPDCIFVFDDKTSSEAGAIYSNHPAINARISDISKTHVGEVFESVFGYNVSVNPLTYTGKAVQKSDANATHDGVIVECPLISENIIEDCVYQKLIDSTHSGAQAEEMRVAYVGGEIPVIFYKYKNLNARFGTSYARVDVKSADDLMSAEEITTLVKFCDAMGLDFGALDVMRDKHDGRIYVVDVNKTCMPVLSLSLKDQMQSLDKIAASLLRLVTRLRFER